MCSWLARLLRRRRPPGPRDPSNRTPPGIPPSWAQ